MSGWVRRRSPPAEYGVKCRIRLTFEVEDEVQMAAETSFDHRIVRYEDIHSIAPNDFVVLVNAAAIEAGCRILDCGCGYGAVTREILRTTGGIHPHQKADLWIALIDESSVQIE